MDISTSELWQPLLTTVAKLSVVLALLLLVLYLMKRFLNAQGPMADRGLIKVMASMHIAPKQRIVLLDVMGEKILIGVSPQAITHLTKVTGESQETETTAQAPQLFNRLLNKTAKEKPPAEPSGQKEAHPTHDKKE